MTYKTLAKKIRQKELALEVARDVLIKEIADLKSQCKHNCVVITASYYAGTYSYDHDDWHPQGRLCVICGKTEMGPTHEPKPGDFKELLNPIRRL